MKLTAILVSLTALLACDPTPAPARVVHEPLAVPAPVAASVAARAGCAAGEKCEGAAECGLGLTCVSGECVAPCEVDEHCEPGSFQPSKCASDGVCRLVNGSAVCPAPCTAGESCTSDADCGPLAPLCVGASGEGKGACVAPCASDKDCHGEGASCSATNECMVGDRPGCN